MRINYGDLYKVTIHFNQDVLTVEEVAEIIDHNFYEEDILSYEDYDVAISWSIPPDEGFHEIENALFYILQNGVYGMYSYEDLSEYDRVDDSYDPIEIIKVKTEIETGELIGFYRVFHLVGPPKSEAYINQLVEIRATGNMKIYDFETKEFITSFVAYRERIEAVMLKAGMIPSEELLSQATSYRDKIRAF